jgi:hypothetical protein
MNNAPAILRSLVIFAVIVPLAVFLGYLLANPLDYATFGYVGVVLLVLVFPLLLRWHYPLLLFSLCTNMTLPFMKGNPNLWLVLVALSLGISVLERAMNSQMHFIRVPQITWPLMFFAAVVVFTAKLTGGIGLHTFGSEVYGGKKYINLIVGILCYFALTARRIPPERAKLFLGLFFAGQVTQLIGDLAPITPSFLHFIYWFFPATGTVYYGGTYELGLTRLGGVGLAGVAICMWMMALYGIRGIFSAGKQWRLLVFLGGVCMVFLGGFRSSIFQVAEVFVLLFFLEGLHRTRLLLKFAFVGLCALVLVIPFASRLPYTFQRALAFLPLDLSRDAVASAEDSSQWRFEMWKALLPQVPKYLLLGKGFAITMEDNEFMGSDTAFRAVDASQQGLALSSDYHSGPLSVIIPFGIWGVIGMLWLLGAGLRVMYCNFRYGDPSVRIINTFLFVYFLCYIINFIFMTGGLSSNMEVFASYLGLSVALNGGVGRPAPQSVQARQPMVHLAKIRPRAHPAFQR